MGEGKGSECLMGTELQFGTMESLETDAGDGRTL